MQTLVPYYNKQKIGNMTAKNVLNMFEDSIQKEKKNL